MRKFLLSLVILFYSLFSFSQNTLDVLFVKHLSDTESYKECIFEINKAADISSYRQTLRDSLLYYKAWSQYSLKLLDSSSETFLKLSDSSSFYSEASLFATYNLIHIGKYKKAIDLCDELSKSSKVNLSLLNLEAAGCSLLKRDYDDFEMYMSKVDQGRYYLKAQSSLLYSFSKELKEHKKKSPLLAAGLSTLLPGLGKIYAGKTGEGLASLFTVGGLGLVSWEQYRKNGINDYKTIIAGTITSLFYLANIYGSYFSVVLTENEFNNAYKNKILFNIHIPLRTFYK
jgi:hypothetical protein